MPYGKAVQRDIEDVPAGPLEPGGHAAQLVVLLQQQHAAAGAGQHVGRRQAGQAAADDDDVVLVLGVFEKIAGHAVEDAGDGGTVVDAETDEFLIILRALWLVDKGVDYFAGSSQIMKPVVGGPGFKRSDEFVTDEEPM